MKGEYSFSLIYGASEHSWIRDQLRQGRKILSQREALTALAIYLGAPAQKKELAVAMPGLLTLDSRRLEPEHASRVC
jgi:hypothetical protein